MTRDPTLRLTPSLAETFAKAFAAFIIEIEQRRTSQLALGQGDAHSHSRSGIRASREGPVHEPSAAVAGEEAFRKAFERAVEAALPLLQPDRSSVSELEARLPRSWDELPEAYRKTVEKEIEEGEKRIADGTQKVMVLTEADIAARIAAGLKEVLRAKRVSQSELARRLGVSPSVITKILRNPERSQLSTLYRITQALEVDLHAVV